MLLKNTTTVLAAVGVLLLALGGAVSASDLSPTTLQQELVRARYDVAVARMASGGLVAQTDEADQPLSAFAQTGTAGTVPYKSAGRAFLYSMAVPGLGQYYYGSKIKPFVFLAIEALTWSQALKYHSNGNDITDEFHAFNATHWERDRYFEFLEHHYGTARPDTLKDTSFKELVEVLPSEKNQQYYEMTGKYDQFAWGWDDAAHGDTTWDVYINGGSYPRKILTKNDVPRSTHRNTYEVMRDDANSNYDKSMRFVFAIMANHLVSAFEAYFVTKSHNNRLRYEQEFARVHFDAGLRSYSSYKDTPYVTMTYKF